MKRIHRLLLLASVPLGALAIPGVVHGGPDGSGGYVVEPGDYLFGIAREVGVPVGDLLAANNLALTDVIHPGQRLSIPRTAPAAASSTSAGRRYTVRPGDSLYGIARRHGVSLRSLLAANRLAIASVIHPGQPLSIPGAAPAPAPAAAPRASAGGSYTVRRGDSLYGIARRHGVSLRSLLSANRLTASSVIHPGQRLALPAAGTTSARAGGAPVAPRPMRSPTPLGAAAVERIIRDVWPDHLEERALAIAWRESRYQPAAQGDCCSGLFQIYYDVHRGWLAELGITSRADLYDARTNAEAALALYRRAGGWGPWALSGE